MPQPVRGWTCEKGQSMTTQPALEDLDLGPTGSPSLPAGLYRWEPARRRVRAVVDGMTVVDSRKVMLLLESGHLPVFYFPMDDVRQDVLTPSSHTTHSPLKGDAAYWSLTAGDRTIEDAVWGYLNPPEGAPDMAGYVALYWGKMDAWYEEETQVFGHARDPYKRIDILPSVERVRMVLGGETVVDTLQPRLLLETGLLTRYYVPAADVRMDLLEPSESSSYCPYKGRASYWSATVGGTTYPDVVWAYHDPLPECLHIKDLLCFYNERLDAIEVGGVTIDVPRTPWS